MQKQSQKYKKPNQTQVHTLPTLSEQQLEMLVGGYTDIPRLGFQNNAKTKVI